MENKFFGKKHYKSDGILGSSAAPLENIHIVCVITRDQ